MLTPSCPRCPARVLQRQDTVTCPVHGVVVPLWRPHVSDYDTFAEIVGRAGEIPLYLPWPMSPGWSIADFGCVADDVRAVATVTTLAGTSDLDGPVEVTVVVEEPGAGLGARCADLDSEDPGDHLGEGRPSVRVRADGREVGLWMLDREAEVPLEAAVFAGESEGRWLWLMMRPASAAMLLRDAWLLADVTGFGPEALEMPFGGPRPTW